MFDLREAILEAAREGPASPYLRHRDAGLTFSEVGPALAQIASQLPSLGGRRVVILLPDGLSAALLHLECFSQGATIVPLSPFSPAAHLQYVLHRVQAELVLATPLLHAKFAGLLQRTAVALVASDTPIRLEVRGAIPLRDEGTQPSPVRAVFFTSGTTGQPKGVCLSESNLLSAAWINRTILGLNSSRRSLITVPLYDYYGAIQLYSHVLAKAACTLGESGQFPRSAFQALDSQAITDMVLVPFTLKALLDHARNSERNEDQQTWRRVAYVASSSDQLSSDLLRGAFTLNPGLAVVNVYGLTEAGRACYRVIRDGANPGASIGNPSPTMKVWVDAPAGQSGEIVISGSTVMLGYLQDIVNEDIHFAPVTEVRTADEGYVGDDGEIHLLGRKDHLMSLQGVKLHPSEIELPVNQLSGVRDSLAQLHQDGQGNRTIVLDVVADRGSVAQNQILDLLRERVPRLFLPHVINFVDAIPRTEIGKLIRPRH
ncbi:MAG TPA: class I adenylate-forming enzyme family protein [Terriglobales bacterium]|nr:class I adenylate-forming enzyme family protein [Terriglobales bacterium]